MANVYDCDIPNRRKGEPKVNLLKCQNKFSEFIIIISNGITRGDVGHVSTSGMSNLTMLTGLWSVEYIIVSIVIHLFLGIWLYQISPPHCLCTICVAYDWNGWLVCVTFVLFGSYHCFSPLHQFYNANYPLICCVFVLVNWFSAFTATGWPLYVSVIVFT